MEKRGVILCILHHSPGTCAAWTSRELWTPLGRFWLELTFFVHHEFPRLSIASRDARDLRLEKMDLRVDRQPTLSSGDYVLGGKI